MPWRWSTRRRRRRSRTSRSASCPGAWQFPDVAARPSRRGRLPCAVLVAVVAAGARGEDAARVASLPPVEVVATTPLPGFGIPLRDVPANVQVFGARELARQRPLT